MSKKTINHNGVKYIDRLLSANRHSFHNETRGGSYVAEHGAENWHIYPANSVTLRHSGYSIGVAKTLADIPAVIYAFEY